MDLLTLKREAQERVDWVIDCAAVKFVVEYERKGLVEVKDLCTGQTTKGRI